MIPVRPETINISDNSINENNTDNQEIIDRSMSHKIDSGLPYRHISKIVKTMIPEQTKIVRSVAPLKKLSTKRFRYTVFIECPSCLIYRKNGICEKCNNNYSIIDNFSRIYYIPIRQQIKYFLKKYFRQIFQYLLDTKHNYDSTFKDIYDGILWKGLQTDDGSIRLSLTMNADGGQCTKSTSKSMWLIQLYQNYLPPKLRFQRDNIILSTIHYEKKKIDPSALIHILSEELKDIQDSSPISALIDGQLVKFHPEITFVSCDLPARLPLMGLRNFNSTYACPHCHHPGELVEDIRRHKYVRYTYKGKQVNRTQKETLDIFITICEKGNDSAMNTLGFKVIPPMVVFPNFDLIDGFLIDHLHCVHLGVMAKLLNIWTGKHKTSKFQKPFTAKQKNTLDQRITRLKPTSEISRLPTKIGNDRAYLKASQYSDLLLYYLYYSLNGLLDFHIIRHFRLFSAAIYLLLQIEISEEDVQKAERLLDKFIKEFEDIYGKDAVTMNLHLLGHLPNLVRKAGPLWAYSTFGFEGNLGKLIRTISRTRNFAEQVAFAYCLERQPKSVSVLQNKPTKKS